MAQIAVSLDRAEPNVGVVGLIGEHDAYSARRLENELSVLLDSRVHVVVDLRETTFVDSQTLSVLLTAQRRAAERSLGFVLAVSDDDYTQVHRILDMTGLASTFVARPTLEQAVATARSGLAAPPHAHVA
jgi:anti-sigma B factor antagonist